jgi:hypothetical protein
VRGGINARLLVAQKALLAQVRTPNPRRPVLSLRQGAYVLQPIDQLKRHLKTTHNKQDTPSTSTLTSPSTPQIPLPSFQTTF